MKLLLDRQVFLWLLNDPELLGPETRTPIEQNSDGVYVSAVSIWELGLKYKKGKLPYGIHEMLDGVEALQVRLLELRPAIVINWSG